MSQEGGAAKLQKQVFGSRTKCQIAKILDN